METGTTKKGMNMKARFKLPVLGVILSAVCLLGISGCSLFSGGGGVDLSLAELLQKMDKASFGERGVPPDSLAVSWVNNYQFFLKTVGHRSRLNVNDDLIVIGDQGKFYVGGKEKPRAAKSILPLQKIFPGDRFENLFPASEWELQPEFAAGDSGACYRIRQTASADGAEYDILVNPRTYLIDSIRVTSPEFKREDGEKPESVTLHLRDYRWIEDKVRLPMMFSPDQGMGTPSVVTEVKVDGKIPETYFDSMFSPPGLLQTKAELDSLRERNLAGKGSADGTLKTFLKFGSVTSNRTFKCPADGKSFGERNIDIAMGLCNLRDLEPGVTVATRPALVNDVWCANVSLPGGKRLYLDPATGAALRYVERPQSVSNYFYRKSKDKLVPYILVTSDGSFCYPINVEWYPAD